jgi:hypothetical protein
MEARVGLILGALVLSAWGAACTALDPEVGPLRGTCPGGSTYENEYPGSAGAAGEEDPRCLDPATADNECAACENRNCCATRFGCYDDTACGCADIEFDECLEATEEVGATDGKAPGERDGGESDGGESGGESDGGSATAKAACWAEFAASGPTAAARVECQRAHCQKECDVP